MAPSGSPRGEGSAPNQPLQRTGHATDGTMPSDETTPGLRRGLFLRGRVSRHTVGFSAVPSTV